MQVHCHSCEQKSSISNSSRSNTAPRCPLCRSEAVQYVQSRNVRGPIDANPRPHRQTLIEREFADPFQQMHQMFNRSNSMFAATNADQMSSMFPAIMDISRIKRMMQMPSFQSQQHIHNMNGPVIFRQHIYSGPHQRVVVYSSNNGQAEDEWEQIPEHLLQPKKPKVQDFPVVAKLSEQCSICNTKQNSGIQLPCGHKFHKQCLKPWFEMKDNCPCCRAKL